MDLFQDIRKLPFIVTNGESLNGNINSGTDDEAFRLLISGKTFPQDELDSALISACNCRYKLLIYKLVHLGADVETKDADGNTPLLICAKHHSTNVVRFLLGRNVNINAANDSGNTALILAIRPAGSVELVKLLLSHNGIHVNHQNKEQDTALMKAIESKNIEVISLLLDLQENAVEALDGIKNCRNETAQKISNKLGIEKIAKLLVKYRIKGRNQILMAIGKCDENCFSNLVGYKLLNSLSTISIINDAFMGFFTAHEKSGVTFNKKEELMIERLLKCGADVNGCSYWFHPVQVATQVGSYNVLQMLLKHGARLDRPALLRPCSNPLMVAVENNRPDFVQLLLRNNLEPLVSTFGKPALACALRNGHTHCAKLLVQHGVLMDVKYALSFPVGNKIPIYFMSVKESHRLKARKLVATSDVKGLVICGKSEGDVDMEGVFLTAEVVKNYSDNIEKGPSKKLGKPAILNFLVQKYGVVNKYRANFRNDNSPIVKFLACNPHSGIMKERIKSMAMKKCHINRKSIGGRTPLMVAISNGESTHIVRLLLDRGADVGARDSKGNTVLLLAVKKNLTENIMCLLNYLQHRSVLDCPNQQGLTPLMIAVENHNYQVIEALICCKANVNAKDKNGNTALLLAVSRYSQELAILKFHVGNESLDQRNRVSFASYVRTGEAFMKKMITLLVSSGADVNVVSKKAPRETALTLLLENSCLGKDIIESMEYLLDHGAKASYATPDVIHLLIQLRNIRLIPKLIHCGFGPVAIQPILRKIPNIFHTISTFSPLCVALLMQNVTLARYFVENLFMTRSDVSMLVYSQVLRHLFASADYSESLDFLKETFSQPVSLFSLAFIAVQSAVGFVPDREERIKMLPLPQPVINMLLFKAMSYNLDVADAETAAAYEKMSMVDLVRATMAAEIQDGCVDYESNYTAHEVDSSDDDWMESNEL